MVGKHNINLTVRFVSLKHWMMSLLVFNTAIYVQTVSVNFLCKNKIYYIEKNLFELQDQTASKIIETL